MAGLSRIPSTALIFAKLASPSTKPAAVFFLISRFCFRMPQAYRILAGWSCPSGSDGPSSIARVPQALHRESSASAVRDARSFACRTECESKSSLLEFCRSERKSLAINQGYKVLVPRRGAKKNSLPGRLACPTFAARSIVFQGLFLKLSHAALRSTAALLKVRW